MSTLINFGFKADSTKQHVNEKGYVNLTIELDDKESPFGTNVSGWIAQSKEERDGQVKRLYVGNGKTIWSSIQAMFIPAKR